MIIRPSQGLLLVFCVLLAACASGPKLSTVQSGLPTVPDSKGRVYFYRTQVFGTAVQPGIHLNGEKVGNCVPRGVFFKDVEPGKYEATVETEVERKLTFTMAAGEEKYVRCYVSMGLFVGRGHLELVSPAEASGEVLKLNYTGQDKK